MLALFSLENLDIIPSCPLHLADTGSCVRVAAHGGYAPPGICSHLLDVFLA